MAVKFNLVKELIRKDVINTNQLIINSIFGNVLPDQYDENKIYEKGSVIIRVNEDGVYELLVSTKDSVTGEFSEEDWEKVSFTDLFKDSSVITQNNIIINNIQEGMADDLATLVYNLAGLLDNDMSFNNIFRENFKNDDNLNITNGIHEIGYLLSDEDGLEFSLYESKGLITQPKKFKLKHYMELVGTVGMECEITFNGLDDNPFWFNANEAILNGSFFDIPEFDKQDEIPYALNFRIKCSCDSSSSIKISDFMVVFI